MLLRHGPGVFILRTVLLIAVAGGLGAVGRYGASCFISNWLGDKFAYGTLAVNVIGCFLLGLLMHVSLSTDMLSEELRMALAIGFLGALTTFSTFSYETFKFIEDGQWALAVANIGANVLLALGATILGLVAGKVLVGGS